MKKMFHVDVFRDSCISLTARKYLKLTVFVIYDYGKGNRAINIVVIPLSRQEQTGTRF
jgi:hypothetical protein